MQIQFAKSDAEKRKTLRYGYRAKKQNPRRKTESLYEIRIGEQEGKVNDEKNIEKLSLLCLYVMDDDKSG